MQRRLQTAEAAGVDHRNPERLQLQTAHAQTPERVRLQPADARLVPDVELFKESIGRRESRHFRHAADVLAIQVVEEHVFRAAVALSDGCRATAGLRRRAQLTDGEEEHDRPPPPPRPLAAGHSPLYLRAGASVLPLAASTRRDDRHGAGMLHVVATRRSLTDESTTTHRVCTLTTSHSDAQCSVWNTDRRSELSIVPLRVYTFRQKSLTTETYRLAVPAARHYHVNGRRRSERCAACSVQRAACCVQAAC